MSDIVTEIQKSELRTLLVAANARIAELEARIAALQPVTEEWIASWDASDPNADEYTEAHAYHAGFAAGVKSVEAHHGIRKSALDVVRESDASGGGEKGEGE